MADQLIKVICADGQFISVNQDWLAKHSLTVQTLLDQNGMKPVSEMRIPLIRKDWWPYVQALIDGKYNWLSTTKLEHIISTPPCQVQNYTTSSVSNWKDPARIPPGRDLEVPWKEATVSIQETSDNVNEMSYIGRFRSG